MFASVFNPNAPFWRNFARFMDLFGLSFCWVVCSIPLLTLGASTTALYDAVYHGVRRGELGDYARFFTTFRRELKNGLLITLPALVLFPLYLFLLRVSSTVAASGNPLAGMMTAAYQVLFCLPLAFWLFACAVLSRFTFAPAALLSTACKLVFAHLPSAALVTAAVVWGFRVVLWLPMAILFLPGAAAWLASFPLERIFAPFLPKEEEEDAIEPET